MISLEGRFALAHDAVAIRMCDLPKAMRRATDATDSDVIWTQTRSRVSSLVVGSDAAALLQSFQDPTAIPEAVVRFARLNSSDATEVLRAAYPLLREAVNRGLLLPESEWKGSRTDPRLSPGAVVGRWTIVRCVQSLLDGEVYEAQADGTRVALKVARDRKAAKRLQREARVLEHLSDGIAARLIDRSLRSKRPYLAIEWLQGQSPVVVAEQLRARGDVTRPARLRLACGILEAYAAIHRKGAVHGDVHPMNMIMDDHGRVRLIDFELARIPGSPAPEHRGLVAYYLEPEAAAELLRGETLPPSSPAGEQFALGALLYELFTGQRYVEFHLEPERFLQQVTSESPRAFDTCGATAWPEVEALLQRALAKNPEHRYNSIGDFNDALRRLAERPASRRQAGKPHRRWLTQRLTNLAAGGEWFHRARTEPPFSSLYTGLSGPAVMHHRLAELRGDAEHLASADCWCAQAEYLTSRRDAYSNSEIRRVAPPVSPSALLHGPLGVALTRAAIAHARCDDQEAVRASRWFRRIASGVPSNPDLTLGRSGILLGAATLMRNPSLSMTEREKVRRVGRRTLASLLRWADNAGGPGTSAWPNLGMAHGWAGILYAMLRWQEADPSSELPDAVPDWLDVLGALGERSGRGLRWPWLQGDRRRVRAHGYA